MAISVVIGGIMQTLEQAGRSPAGDSRVSFAALLHCPTMFKNDNPSNHDSKIMAFELVLLKLHELLSLQCKMAKFM